VCVCVGPNTPREQSSLPKNYTNNRPVYTPTTRLLVYSQHITH